MADATPQFTVADACMSFTQAINDRHSLMSPEDAQAAGQDLFTWFQEEGALTADRAPFAVRSVQLGTKAVEALLPQSIDDIIASIKANYGHYSGGL